MIHTAHSSLSEWELTFSVPICLVKIPGLFWIELLQFAPKSRVYLKIIDGEIEALSN